MDAAAAHAIFAAAWRASADGAACAAFAAAVLAPTQEPGRAPDGLAWWRAAAVAPHSARGLQHDVACVLASIWRALAKADQTAGAPAHESPALVAAARAMLAPIQPDDVRGLAVHGTSQHAPPAAQSGPHPSAPTPCWWEPGVRSATRGGGAAAAKVCFARVRRIAPVAPALNPRLRAFAAEALAGQWYAGDRARKALRHVPAGNVACATDPFVETWLTADHIVENILRVPDELGHGPPRTHASALAWAAAGVDAQPLAALLTNVPYEMLMRVRGKVATHTLANLIAPRARCALVAALIGAIVLRHPTLIVPDVCPLKAMQHAFAPLLRFPSGAGYNANPRELSAASAQAARDARALAYLVRAGLVRLPGAPRPLAAPPPIEAWGTNARVFAAAVPPKSLRLRPTPVRVPAGLAHADAFLLVEIPPAAKATPWAPTNASSNPSGDDSDVWIALAHPDARAAAEARARATERLTGASLTLSPEVEKAKEFLRVRVSGDPSAGRRARRLLPCSSVHFAKQRSGAAERGAAWLADAAAVAAMARSPEQPALVEHHVALALGASVVHMPPPADGMDLPLPPPADGAITANTASVLPLAVGSTASPGAFAMPNAPNGALAQAFVGELDTRYADALAEVLDAGAGSLRACRQANAMEMGAIARMRLRDASTGAPTEITLSWQAPACKESGRWVIAHQASAIGPVGGMHAERFSRGASRHCSRTTVELSGCSPILSGAGVPGALTLAARIPDVAIGLTSLVAPPAPAAESARGAWATGGGVAAATSSSAAGDASASGIAAALGNKPPSAVDWHAIVSSFGCALDTAEVVRETIAWDVPSVAVKLVVTDTNTVRVQLAIGFAPATVIASIVEPLLTPRAAAACTAAEGMDEDLPECTLSHELGKRYLRVEARLAAGGEIAYSDTPTHLCTCIAAFSASIASKLQNVWVEAVLVEEAARLLQATWRAHCRDSLGARRCLAYFEGGDAHLAPFVRHRMVRISVSSALADKPPCSREQLHKSSHSGSLTKSSSSQNLVGDSGFVVPTSAPIPIGRPADAIDASEFKVEESSPRTSTPDTDKPNSLASDDDKARDDDDDAADGRLLPSCVRETDDLSPSICPPGERHSGIVLWYGRFQGYGFIALLGHGKRNMRLAFMHRSALSSARDESSNPIPRQGDVWSFGLRMHRGRLIVYDADLLKALPSETHKHLKSYFHPGISGAYTTSTKLASNSVDSPSASKLTYIRPAKLAQCIYDKLRANLNGPDALLQIASDYDGDTYDFLPVPEEEQPKAPAAGNVAIMQRQQGGIMGGDELAKKPAANKSARSAQGFDHLGLKQMPSSPSKSQVSVLDSALDQSNSSADDRSTTSTSGDEAVPSLANDSIPRSHTSGGTDHRNRPPHMPQIKTRNSTQKVWQPKHAHTSDAKDEGPPHRKAGSRSNPTQLSANAAIFQPVPAVGAPVPIMISAPPQPQIWMSGPDGVLQPMSPTMHEMMPPGTWFSPHSSPTASAGAWFPGADVSVSHGWGDFDSYMPAVVPVPGSEPMLLNDGFVDTAVKEMFVPNPS